MKKLFIIANWKSNKTTEEAVAWFTTIQTLLPPKATWEDKNFVLCVPATLLAICKKQITEKNLPISLGAQNVSPFPIGAYTGEIAATQLKEFANFVLIGHSERRMNLNETDEMLVKKVVQAKNVGLTPVYLVQGKETLIPEGIEIVGYEPVSAIGSGNPDTPENVEDVARFIKEQKHIPYVLYGGSVNGENVHSFTSLPSVDGIIPGNASLDPQKIVSIIQHA